MDRDSALKAALAPLEQALMQAASDEAAKRRDDAETQAHHTADAGAAHAQELIDQAKAQGEQAAQRAAAHRLVSAKREARGVVLGAKSNAYRQLLDRSVAAMSALHDDRGYPELEQRLAGMAVALLGPKAHVDRDPDGQGGIRARNGARTVDLTLPTLARRCVTQLGERVTALWS